MGTREENEKEYIRKLNDGTKEIIEVKAGVYLDVKGFNDVEDKFYLTLKPGEKKIEFTHMGALFLGIKDSDGTGYSSMVIIRNYNKEISESEKTIHDHNEVVKESHHFIRSLKDLQVSPKEELRQIRPSDIWEIELKQIQSKENEHKPLKPSTTPKIEKPKDTTPNSEIWNRAGKRLIT